VFVLISLIGDAATLIVLIGNENPVAVLATDLGHETKPTDTSQEVNKESKQKSPMVGMR
jgi:hypothetical protein